jgi:hypothetical protein
MQNLKHTFLGWAKATSSKPSSYPHTLIVICFFALWRHHWAAHGSFCVVFGRRFLILDSWLILPHIMWVWLPGSPNPPGDLQQQTVFILVAFRYNSATPRPRCNQPALLLGPLTGGRSRFGLNHPSGGPSKAVWHPLK